MRADPLRPVAFAGDVPIRAEGVAAPCEDFNVMVRRGAMRAEVSVCDGGSLPGGMAALFALGPVTVKGIPVAAHELILTDEVLPFVGHAILVVLHAS